MTYNFRLYIIAIVFSAALFGVFLLGISSGSSYIAYDLNRIILIITLLIVIFLNFQNFNSYTTSFDNWRWLGLAIFFGSSVLSDILSDSSSFKLSNLFLFLFFWVFIFSFRFQGYFGSGYLFARRILFIAVALSVLSCLLVFLFWVKSDHYLALKFSVLNAGYLNINFFGQIATWLIPLYCFVIIDTKNKNFKIISCATFLALVLLFFFILLLSIRGTLLSIIISGFLVAVLFRSDSWRILRVLFGALFVALPVWFIYEWGGHGFGGQGVHLTQVDPLGRSMLWKEALMMSLVNFPFGMGSESWITHSTLSDSFYQPLAHGHPHNMYLLWAAEYGWLSVFGGGLMAMAFLKEIFLYRKVKKLDSMNFKYSNEIVVGLVLSGIAGILHSGVSGVLLVPSSMIVGGIVLALAHGLIGGAVKNKKEDVLMRGSRKLISLTLAFVIVIGGIFFVVNTSKYYFVMSLDKERYSESGKPMYFPRFWVHGNAVDIEGSYQRSEADALPLETE